MNEQKRQNNEAPLGEIIEKLMRAYGLDHKMKELDILDSWSDMMGLAVAHRTKNLRIQNKVLYLTMDSAVMRDELQHGKQIIIGRINEKAGYTMIEDVWFG